jgi:hypothetical protein
MEKILPQHLRNPMILPKEKALLHLSYEILAEIY